MPRSKPANPCTGLIFSARDDSELHGLLARIQDLALHLISFYEIGGTEAVPQPPVRASLAHPGTSPYTTAGPHNPPVGSRGPARAPARAPAARLRAAPGQPRPALGGTWAGFGGAVNHGDTPWEAAVREMGQEVSGITLDPAGIAGDPNRRLSRSRF